MVAASLDEVAYLFNLRGQDIACCPVALAYAVVTTGGSGGGGESGGCQASLYIDRDKLSGEASMHLMASGVAIKPYESIRQDLETLVVSSGAKLMVDPKRVNFGLLAPLGYVDSIIDSLIHSFVLNGCDPPTNR